MSKQTITIPLHKAEPVQVEADVFMGLAVHKEIMPNGRASSHRLDWTVTHAESGQGIPVAFFRPTLRNARRWREILLEVSPRGFWTQPIEAIRSKIGFSYYQAAQDVAFNESGEQIAAKMAGRSGGYQGYASGVRTA